MTCIYWDCFCLRVKKTSHYSLRSLTFQTRRQLERLLLSQFWKTKRRTIQKSRLSEAYRPRSKSWGWLWSCFRPDTSECRWAALTRSSPDTSLTKRSEFKYELRKPIKRQSGYILRWYFVKMLSAWFSTVAINWPYVPSHCKTVMFGL